MTLKPPPKLYKYQPYTVQTIDNLKNRLLWFSKPGKFNDPFDCKISFKIQEMTQDYLQLLFEKVRNQEHNKLAFDAKFSQEGRPNDNFKSEVVSNSDKFFSDYVNGMIQHQGVACFSEKVDDILMWAHYADGHRGFCLEFDTTYDPFPKAFPVTYSDALPTLNPTDILIRNLYDPMMAIMTTKSSGWSYEKEWRIFHNEGDKKYVVEVPALTGVYFGCAMPFIHIEIIALILRGSPTQLYEMKRSKKEFKVSFKPVDYKPFDYSKKQTST